jgi:hypothetical protein
MTPVAIQFRQRMLQHQRESVCLPNLDSRRRNKRVARYAEGEGLK